MLQEWKKKRLQITAGVAKLIVCIAQVVPQPIRTSENFQEIAIYKYYTPVNECFR